jgi:hypothetical protein
MTEGVDSSVLAHRARSESARLGKGRVLARLGWVCEKDARSERPSSRLSHSEVM